MRVLIDTHALLWYMAGDRRLSGAARDAIDDRENDRPLSAAVLWEIAIKQSVGKLRLGEPFESLIPQTIEQNGLSLLAITVPHAAAVAALPYPPNGHRDPFDRLMIAQAMVERVPIISGDAKLRDYEVELLW